MRVSRRTIVPVLAPFASALALALGGCLAVPPAMLISAGLGAAPSGVAAFDRGQLRAFIELPLERSYDATYAALTDLGFDIGTTRLSEDSAFILARDADETEIKVRIERRTEFVTGIRIRVGFVGNRMLSALILQRMRELATPGEEGVPPMHINQ